MEKIVKRELPKATAAQMANDGTISYWLTIKNFLELEVEDMSVQRGDVWTTKQYTELLATINDNDVIPSISLGKLEGGNLQLVDGKQRTKAIRYLANIVETNVNMAKKAKYPDDKAKSDAMAIVEGIRDRFYNYKLLVLVRTYDSLETMEMAFTRQNNGTPLTKAQKSKGEYCNSVVTLLNKISNHNLFSLLAKKTSKLTIDGKQYEDAKVRKMDDITTFILYSYFSPENAQTSSTAVVSALKKITDKNIVWPVDVAWSEINSYLDRMTSIYECLQDNTCKKALQVLSQPNNIVLLFTLSILTKDDSIDVFKNTVYKLYDIAGENPSGKPKPLPFTYKEDGITVDTTFDSLFGAGSGNNAAATRRRVAGAMRAAELARKAIAKAHKAKSDGCNLEALVEQARGIVDDGQANG